MRGSTELSVRGNLKIPLRLISGIDGEGTFTAAAIKSEREKER